jgi:hypothetical protein
MSELTTIKQLAELANVSELTIRRAIDDIFPGLMVNGVKTVLNSEQAEIILHNVKFKGGLTVQNTPIQNEQVSNLPENPLEMAKHQLESMLKMITAIQETQAKQKEQDSRITQLENRVQKRFSDDFENQFVTPTQIGAMFEPTLSAKVVNRLLKEYNLQWKVDGQWVPREQGKKYSTYDYIQLDNGKTVPQLLWQRKVKELLA